MSKIVLYIIVSTLSLSMIIQHEGYSPVAYRDRGHYSIGYGTYSHKGETITEDRAMLLVNDAKDKCYIDLLKILNGDIRGISPLRLSALIDMRYNLGASGFREFKEMLKCLRIRDWYGVSREAKNSVWYTQVANRGKDIVHILKYDEMRKEDR